ncbi:MAG: APC family permease [Methanomassiliicoccus sp.]|nr:APC family permease [Methanomassiliicoccus sp.]
MTEVVDAVDDSPFERNLNWKQGVAIAMGAPVLILPSIGYTVSYLWGAAVILWALSVMQTILQNIAYAELATTFPRASGLPGFAQAVLSKKEGNGKKKYTLSKFIGGFSSWSYWFAWNPVLAVMTITAAWYIKGVVPAFADIDVVVLSLILGAVIFSSLIIVNLKGLANGAKLGLVLAIVAIIPVMTISLAPIGTSVFDLSNVTDAILPTTWAWDMEHILILAGLFAIALWSTGGSEAVAIYGPRYKNPRKDLPKALLVCVSIIMVTFVWIQASATATLGIDGILAEPVSPLIGMATIAFGSAIAPFVLLVLIAAIILMTQTAILGSGIAMQQMAEVGNLPKIFAKVNSYGIPVRAMIFIAIFNILLITLRTPVAIIAAASFGYILVNGISLFAFVKARRDPELKKLPRPYKAPKSWTFVAILVGLFNIPIILAGLIYLQIYEAGLQPVIVGAVVLLLYIPIWFYSQKGYEEPDKNVEAVPEVG